MRLSLFLAFVVMLICIATVDLKKSKVCKPKYVTSFELVAPKGPRKKVAGSMSPASNVEFQCPDNRPILIGGEKENSEMTCGDAVECVEDCYTSNICESWIGPMLRNDFATKLSCKINSDDERTCVLTCCHSQMYELNHCDNATLKVSGSVTIDKSKKSAGGRRHKKSANKKASDVGLCEIQLKDPPVSCTSRPKRVPETEEC